MPCPSHALCATTRVAGKLRISTCSATKLPMLPPPAVSPSHAPAASAETVPSRQQSSKSASVPCLLLAGRGIDSVHSVRSLRSSLPWKRRSSAGDVDAALPDAAAAAAATTAGLLPPPAKRLCSQSEPSVDKVQPCASPFFGKGHVSGQRGVTVCSKVYAARCKCMQRGVTKCLACCPCTNSVWVSSLMV